MTAVALSEKVIAIDRRLDEVDLPHAFGGALALASYAEPRMTIDVDVNVFVGAERHPDVIDALADLGVGDDAPLAQVVRDGQCRVAWGATPIDLFYAYHDLHEAMLEGVRRARLGDATIPILAPEHLMACKAIFSRPKDWLDIEQILVGALDADHGEVRGWLERIVGPDDPRAVRFAELSRVFARN